jgi:hypothetical protein
MKFHYTSILLIALATNAVGQIADDGLPFLPDESVTIGQLPGTSSQTGESAQTPSPRFTPSAQESDWGLPDLPTDEPVNSGMHIPSNVTDEFEGETIYSRNTGNAKALLNAFISSIAAESPWLKKEISRYRADPPAGVQIGYSKNLGKFTYRPKTWDDLTDGQQQSIIRDPRLKSFLISMRSPENHPKTEFNYGKPEKGEGLVDGYARKELDEMRAMVQTLKEEQTQLVSELRIAMNLLKEDVTGIREDQRELIGNIDEAVVSLKIEQDEAVERLNSTVEELKVTQGGIMEELNLSVLIAIEEHKKILDVLKEQRQEMEAQWTQFHEEIYEMMSHAKPLDLVVKRGGFNSVVVGASKVVPSDDMVEIEPYVEIPGKGSLVRKTPKKQFAAAKETTRGSVVGEPTSKGTMLIPAREALLSNNANRGGYFLFEVPETDKGKSYTIEIDGLELIRGKLL